MPVVMIRNTQKQSHVQSCAIWLASCLYMQPIMMQCSRKELKIMVRNQKLESLGLEIEKQSYSINDEGSSVHVCVRR